MAKKDNDLILLIQSLISDLDANLDMADVFERTAKDAAEDLRRIPEERSQAHLIPGMDAYLKQRERHAHELLSKVDEWKERNRISQQRRGLLKKSLAALKRGDKDEAERLLGEAHKLLHGE